MGFLKDIDQIAPVIFASMTLDLFQLTYLSHEERSHEDQHRVSFARRVD